MVRHGKAGQSAVLVAADALDEGRFSVEQESVFRNFNRAEANVRRVLVAGVAIPAKCCAHSVEIRRFAVPEKWIGHSCFIMENTLLPRRKRQRFLRRSGAHTVFVQKLGSCRNLMRFIIVIDDRRLKIHTPAVLVQLFRRCINAPERNGNTVGDCQMHIAVDAAALIPPSLEILPVDVDRKDVFLIVIHIIADIKLKSVIGRKIVSHAAAVEIDRALARHTVKPQQNALALRSLRHLKMPAVPCVVIV